MDIKKGAVAYVLSTATIACASLFISIGTLALHFTSNGVVRYVATDLTEKGKVGLAVGFMWLLLSFVGSFFSFDTRGLLNKATMGAVGTLSISLLSGSIALFCGVDMLKHPWISQVLLDLVVTSFLLLSSFFFLHAARIPNNDRAWIEKILQQLASSRKLFVIRPPKEYDN